MDDTSPRSELSRKERRANYGRDTRNRAASRPWTASDYIRKDWETAVLVEFLEKCAKGYNGRLRELLCSSAAMLREQEIILDGCRQQTMDELREITEDLNRKEDAALKEVPADASAFLG